MSVRRKRQVQGNKRVSRSGLFRHYFLVLFSIIVGCLLALGISMLFLVTDFRWNEKAETLKESGKRICDFVLEKGVFESGNDDNFAIVGENLSMISQATAADFFICDGNGDIIICSETCHKPPNSVCAKHDSIVIADNENEDFLTQALETGYSGYAKLSDESLISAYIAAVPIVFDGKSVGAVFAVEDIVEGLLPYMKSITKLFFWSATILLVFIFIAAYTFSYGVAKPVTEMTEATKHYAGGDFEFRVNEDYKQKEMKELAAGMNRMAMDLSVEDKAKKSFVANVSHELKTPMTSIAGFVDGILDGTIPEEKQKHYLSIVSSEVNRLSRLVVAMLNLSKIESGEVKIKPIRYDVSTQIFETMLSFEQMIETKGIKIEGFEQMSGVTMCGDRDLLNQVFYNLLDNAVKFTPPGGSIILFAQNSNGETSVRIRNTGAGVTQAEIKRIFERFYKVDKSRSFDTKGVGLGLYIVKTIVSMHGGEIYPISEPGRFMEFTVVIPDRQDLQNPL